MIAAAALLFGVTVPPANVVDQYGPYADPTQPSVGANATLTPTSDPAVSDDGAAGLWDWTHPALAAVEAGVDTPVGVGTALPSAGPVGPPPVGVCPVNNWRICVDDRNKQPLAGVIVVVSQNGAAVQSEVTGADGIAGFALDPGSYTAKTIYKNKTSEGTAFNVGS